MRARRGEDWQRDLAERHPMEQRVESEIDRVGVLTLLKSSTTAMDRLDYQVLCPGDRLCEIELKTKRQPYRGWGTFRPDVAEQDLFIVDELTIRKLIDAGRYGVLLVRDAPLHRWIVWTPMDLMFASKVRVARQLATGRGGTKGKVLLNLADSPHHFPLLEAALVGIAGLIEQTDENWTGIGAWPGLGTVPLVGEAS
jgi:hypothetical protein